MSRKVEHFNFFSLPLKEYLNHPKSLNNLSFLQIPASKTRG